MKTQITKYIFKDDKSGNEYGIFGGKTQKDARNEISSIGSFTYLRTEYSEYKHGEKYAALCKALGKEWKCSPMSKEYPDCGFSFVRTDGLGFFATRDGWDSKGKNSFMFDAPKTSKGQTMDIYIKGYKVPSPSINCSTSKPVEQLAKDITRRLLPECERVFALHMERIEQSEAYYLKEETAKGVLTQLKDAKGMRFDCNGEHIRVAGYMSPADALKVSNFLKTL